MKTFKRVFSAAVCFIAAVVGLSCVACDNDETLQVPEIYDGNWGNAHWVRISAENNKNVWADYRRDFNLSAVPAEATLKIACDNKYWLYINEQLVVAEGGLNRGPDESNTYYDEVEISPYLREGKNNICVLAWFWGETESETHYITSQKRAVIISTSLHDERNRLVDTGDGRWYSNIDSAYTQGGTRPNMYLGEFNIAYDASVAVDWISDEFSPKNEGWAIAEPVGNDEEDPGYAGDSPWNELVLRPIPQFKMYDIVTVSSEMCDTTSSNGIIGYTLTLPYNMQVYPYIELGTGTVSGKQIIAETETVNMSGLRMSYKTKTGAQTYEHKGWISGDKLTFYVPDGVNVIKLGYRQTGYAAESGDNTLFRGYFDSVIAQSDLSSEKFTGGHSWTGEEVSADNNFYDELWNKALYTLYLCMRDGYMDCPDRERGQYIGDAINEIEEAFYAIGPSANALSAKAIREICAGQIEYTRNGRTYYAMSCIEPYPSVHEIPIQALGTAVAAWTYYQFTGDTTIARDCFEALYNYLTNYDFVSDGKYAGTIRMRESDELIKQTSFADWTDWEDNQDVRVAINCWWYLSATAVRNLAEVDSSDATVEQISWLDANISKVKENFNKFWNEPLKAYATNFSEDDWYMAVEREDQSHLVDDRVNALAVVAGLADEDKYQEIRDVLMGTDSSPAYMNSSIYMEKYAIQALYMMGYPEDAMTRMQLRFMNIVNDSNSSTLPEYWDLMKGTKNHGWSGGALVALSRYSTGIQPVLPGWQKWEMCPQLGNFTSISTNVPSEIGDIGLEITVLNNELNMTVISPGGEATIYVPANGNDIVCLSDDVDYLGITQRYNTQYAVFKISTSGTFVFKTG